MQSNKNFHDAVQSGTDAVLIQVARSESFRTKLTASALATAAVIALTLTIAPTEVHAQNDVIRAAKDALGGIIGGAVGNQFGKGNGKTAATVAGAAAGVWITEELSGNQNNAQQARQTQQIRREFAPEGLDARSFAPNGYAAPAAVANVRQTSNALQSGTVIISPDRLKKLTDKENGFLAARDNFARKLNDAQQAEIDAVLTSGSRQVAQQRTATSAAEQEAATLYVNARNEFVSAVEYMGSRGYDVHQFAFSYNLASQRLTAKDLSVRDTNAVIYQRGQQPAQQERGENYVRY